MTEPDPPTDESQPRRRWRWWWLLAILPAALLADGLHAVYVAAAVDAWAADRELNADGVLAGCEAYDLPAVEAAEPGAAILLVHGFNASPRHWNLVAPALAEAGHACRVMRLPGAAKPFALHQDRDPGEWIDAVLAELAALRAKHPRVGVVGHSLGGAVTLGALLAEPEAADFAVLLAPAIGVSNDRAPVLSTRTWHETARRLLWFTKVVRTPFPMDCRDPKKTDHPGRMPFSSGKTVTALFELLDRIADRAGDVRTPLTMIVSRGDPIVDTPAAEAYFQDLASEDKRLVVLEESGHEIPLDQEWPRVVDAIAERAQP